MVGKQWIKALGTPEAKQLIVESIAPAVFLKRMDEDNLWTIVDAREIEPSHFQYECIEDLQKEINAQIFIKEENICLLTKSEDQETIKLLKDYWYHSTNLESLNRDKNTLTKFTFQLLSLEKLIPSLLEPFPIEILLNILIDSLSEVFTASAAAYKSTENKKLKKIGSSGSYEFPTEFKQCDKSYPGSVIEEEGYLITCLSEDNEDALNYHLLFHRDNPFHDEEISLLKTLTSLLQKSRHLLNEQTKHNEIESLINQFEFILQILKNFSVNILSSFDEEELRKNICDSLKEMFQAEFVSIYERIPQTNTFRLLRYFDLKNRDFDRRIELSDHYETGKLTVKTTFYYQTCYGIITDTDRTLIIFIGESVLQNYYKKEIIDVLDKIIPFEIQRAFSNVDAINTVKEQKKYIENIVEDMWYISENIQDIESVRSKNQLLEKLNSIIQATTTFEITDIGLGLNGKSEEGEQTLTLSNNETTLGSISYISGRVGDQRENYLLHYLGYLGLQTLEKIKVFKNDRAITDLEDVLVDYLKVKYRLAGYSGQPNILEVPSGTFTDSDLDGLGVGIRLGDGLFIATYLKPADISRLTARE